MWIVSGFSFLKMYHFVALRQNDTNVKNILTSSLVVGYIICTVANCIAFSITIYVDNILIIISSIILGFLMGKLVLSAKIKPILDFFGILDTGNVYMWDDLMDKRYPMKISININKYTYVGMIHNIENYTNMPHIALASYIVLNKKGKIVEDYSIDSTRVIVLDTSLAEKIEIIYDNNSDECDDIKALCQYSNENFHNREE